MNNEASFTIEDDETGQPGAAPSHQMLAGLPPGLQSAFHAVKALITMVNGGNAAPGRGVQAMPSEPAALTEEQWLHVFRNSSPAAVKGQFLKFFGTFQDQVLKEAQSAAASIMYSEEKLKPLRSTLKKLESQVDLSARSDDAQAGGHYIAKLLDTEEDIQHYEQLLEDARGRKRIAERSQEIAHLQLRALMKALDRWQELRAGAEAAGIRENLARLQGGMTRMIGQLTEDSTVVLAASHGYAEAASVESSMDLRLRQHRIMEEWEKRRRRK